MTTMQINRKDLEFDAYLLFMDSYNYSKDELIGYYILINEIATKEHLWDSIITIEGLKEDLEILSSNDRKILELFYIKNMSYAKIAKKLNCSIKNIYKVIEKSIQKLRLKAYNFSSELKKERLNLVNNLFKEISNLYPSKIDFDISILGFSNDITNHLKKFNIICLSELLQFDETTLLNQIPNRIKAQRFISDIKEFKDLYNQNPEIFIKKLNLLYIKKYILKYRNLKNDFDIMFLNLSSKTCTKLKRNYISSTFDFLCLNEIKAENLRSIGICSQDEIFKLQYELLKLLN